jgi:hypothetical protein
MSASARSGRSLNGTIAGAGEYVVQEENMMHMKQAGLRKFHRQLGIALAFFLIVQTGTGLLLSINELGESHGDEIAAEKGEHRGNAPGDREVARSARDTDPTAWDQALMTVHHGGGPAGAIYRIILAIVVLAQILLGILIFSGMRSRSRASRPRTT